MGVTNVTPKIGDVQKFFFKISIKCKLPLLCCCRLSLSDGRQYHGADQDMMIIWTINFVKLELLSASAV